MRKIAHYWKIKCPTCGAETISSAQEGTKAKCSHFNRFLPEESLVLYYNDLGEEMAVRLDSVGQICYSFSCPLCNEKIEACATEEALQYYVETSCTHFITLRKDKDEKASAVFVDSFGNVYPVEI